MTPGSDPDAVRDASRAAWERSAVGWSRFAEQVSAWSAPVAEAMITGAELSPGLRVLDLAAGGGDLTLLAAPRVAPDGAVICSDGAPAMLEIARRRVAAAGTTTVEFRQLELEWIDLPTADVDVVLCRWGIMLVVDPSAAAHEIRRVLRPGGRAALAVWDLAARNPWATIPQAAFIELGHAEPPDPSAPGMFRLAPGGALEELLADAGLVEIDVHPVALSRRFASLDGYLAEIVAMSGAMREVNERLSDAQRAAVAERVAAAALPYTAEDGTLVLPGSSLVAVASA